jgi:MFS family permease
MLGLFMVLPIFVLEARHYAGGEDATRVGIAMGIYGLVQALLQIPFGVAADRFGRKRVIQLGLILFVLGSLIGAFTQSLDGLTIARALQGCGAISAAVSALLADQTREEVRTFGMALIGASIGLMFALSLVLGPVFAGMGGLSTVFAVSFVLGLVAMAIVAWWTPTEVSISEQAGQNTSGRAPSGSLGTLLQPDLMRLNVGVFVLYCVQLANWVAIPAMLSSAGVMPAQHGWVYLPAVLLSFVVMGGTLFPLERRGLLKPLFLGSILLVALVELGWSWSVQGAANIYCLEALLFLFFCGFNILEASQPSLASKMANPSTRGITMGVYNTLQSLGIFAGAAGGAWLAKTYTSQAVFLVSTVLLLIWWVVAYPMNYTPAKLAKNSNEGA